MLLCVAFVALRFFSQSLSYTMHFRDNTPSRRSGLRGGNAEAGDAELATSREPYHPRHAYARLFLFSCSIYVPFSHMVKFLFVTVG